MSRVDLFNGATIKIEGTNTSYHTYTNWGLYITNTNCIGDPEQYTKYVEVPGRDGLVDLSEAISGRQVYKKREIKTNLAANGRFYTPEHRREAQGFRRHCRRVQKTNLLHPRPVARRESFELCA